MKPSVLLKLTSVALLAVLVATGCQSKKPKNVTPISGTPTRITANTPEVGTGTKPTTPDNLTPGGTNLTPGPVTPGVVPIPVTIPDRPPIGVSADGSIPAVGPDMFEGMPMDRAAFAANTVHFDYDKSILKASEVGKLKPVITALKASPQNKLLIEGHCDERGTEEYNRALGERRALAIRTHLVKSGIAPDRLRTISFGEDKPIALGHDEAAWAKNRRGELVLLKPKN